jgi:hypothetical protein
MNPWLIALGVAGVVINALGIEGGRQALRAAQPNAENRSAALYMIARSAALSIAALVGGLGLLMGWPLQMAGWMYGVASATWLVQVLDVPIWISRGKGWWAAGAVVCAVIVLAFASASLFVA